MYEKGFRKEYKELMNIWAIFAFFDFNFYWKITISSELMKNRENKNLIFRGVGGGVKASFSKIFGGLGGWGLGGVCINHCYNLIPMYDQ